MLQQFQSYWRDRAPRERLLLGGGGAFLLLALLFAYVWQPMQQQRAALHARLPAIREQAQQMHAQLAEAKGLHAHVRAVNIPDLRATLLQTAQAQGVSLASVTLMDSGHAEVQVQDGAWQKLSDWLVILQGQYHLRAQAVTLDAGKQSGGVNGRLVIEVTGMYR